MAAFRARHVVLIAYAALISLCICESCDPSLHIPLSIPIRNVSLQSPAVRRGVAGSIGTPPVPIAFQIHALANNVFIYDTNGVCVDATTAIQCSCKNGGAFDENDSSSWTLLDLDKDDHIKESPLINVSTDVFGSDTLALEPSIQLPGFNFHIPRKRAGENIGMNSLGLGTNSTTLSEMKKTNQIASRSWSLYQGLTGEDPAHQLDGNLILGGMDQAKVQGENYTTQLTVSSNKCPTGLLVTVTSIVMDTSDQGSIDIIGSSRGSALQMCIEPDYPLITLPYDISHSFYGNATGTDFDFDTDRRARGLNLWGFDFDKSDVYTGGLTFILSSGLKVSIPNDQLVVPDISIAADGTTVFNSSVREVMINSLQDLNTNDMPILGHTFLSQIYLNVNYDLDIFSLWSARATGEEDLVGIGPGGSLGCGKGAATKPGNVTTSPGQPAENSTSTKPKASSPMSPGEKGGIAVGAIGAVALLVAAFYVTRYYRRRHGFLRYSNRSAAGVTSGASLEDQVRRRNTYTKAELPTENPADSRPKLGQKSTTESSSRVSWHQNTTESSSTHASHSLLEMSDLAPVSAPIAELAAENCSNRS